MSVTKFVHVVIYYDCMLHVSASLGHHKVYTKKKYEEEQQFCLSLSNFCPPTDCSCSGSLLYLSNTHTW